MVEVRVDIDNMNFATRQVVEMSSRVETFDH
jgi:hypothetical protein